MLPRFWYRVGQGRIVDILAMLEVQAEMHSLHCFPSPQRGEARRGEAQRGGKPREGRTRAGNPVRAVPPPNLPPAGGGVGERGVE
jgi:hypothetical protein